MILNSASHLASASARSLILSANAHIGALCRNNDPLSWASWLSPRIDSGCVPMNAGITLKGVFITDFRIIVEKYVHVECSFEPK